MIKSGHVKILNNTLFIINTYIIMILYYTSNDYYNQLFILVSLINILFFFVIDYNNYTALFMYFNSLSINYIIYKDIYFEIKNYRSNINFMIMPKFYPSYRNLTKYIWFLNSLSIFMCTIKLCCDFWLYHFEGFTFNKPINYSISLVIITLTSNIVACICIIIFAHYLLSYLNVVHKYLKQIMFNYINNQPLINKDNEHKELICWVCDRTLNKSIILKKLICPCNEYFHPECIDKYLNIYNNLCRAGHKIGKYEHTA